MARIMKGHYSKKFEQYGASPEGVDWGKKHREVELMLKMSGIILEPSLEGMSILDVGCGYGAFYGYLKKHFKGVPRYTGIDLCDNMVREAKAEHRKNNFIAGDFMAYDFGKKKFDYVICNGIFTQKLTANNSEMFEYLKSFIKKMDKLSKKGFVFNVMSTHVNFKVRNLYYLDPAKILSYLLSNVSKNVKLDHSYGFYEYTCYVRK